MPISERFDPVQIAQAGSAMAGLEGAAATASGAVLLWGWMFDPDREVQGLSCELAGGTLEVEILDRTPRPDVVEAHAAVVRSRSPDVGLLALVQAGPDQIRDAGGRLRLEMQTSAGSASSANRFSLRPGAPLSDLLPSHSPVSQLRPAAVARVAETFWAPQAAQTLAAARTEAVTEAFGPSVAPRLSLVVPLGGNAGVLRETLAYLDMGLDMGPERSALELVLSVADPAGAEDPDRVIRDAAADLSVRVVRSGDALSVGAAARLGLEAATAPCVLLMSDAVAPPSGPWLQSVLADLDGAGFAAVGALPRFDGLHQRFAPRLPSAGSIGRTHEAVVARLRSVAGALGLDAWSPGMIAGRRQDLLDLPFSWSALSTADAFWTSLLAHAVQRGAAALRAGGGFTVAPVEPPGDDLGGELMDLHQLAAQLERIAASHRPDLAA